MHWPVIWDRLGTGGGRVAMDVWVCRCVGGQRVKMRIIGRWLGVRYDSAFCQQLVRLSLCNGMKTDCSKKRSRVWQSV